MNESDEAIRVAQVTRLEGRRLADFVRVYEDSFPDEEREEAEPLLASVSAGERDCLIAGDEDSLVGFAISFPLAGAAALFLEYLAVDRERRSEGIGGLLMGRLRERLDQTKRAGLIFEVEDPDQPEATDRAQLRRRVDFYRRHGCSIVDAAPRYRAPRLDNGELMPYRLMWRPAVDGPAALEGEVLRRIVRAILVESYGLESQDPRVTAVVGDLG